MKLKYILPFMACSGAAGAATVLNVSEDGYTHSTNDGSGYGSNSVVQDGGTGNRLSIATPNPAGAWNYTRRAYFGFDVSSITLADVTAATFTVTTASDISGYDTGNTIRAYLLSDLLGGDQIDETTLHWNGAAAAGYMTKGSVLDDRVDGVSVGEWTSAGAANDQTIEFVFGAPELAELAGDTNSFLTFVIENRSQNNGGFGALTGFGFDSKESGTPATLSLTLVPEPSSTALLGLGALGFLIRRKR